MSYMIDLAESGFLPDSLIRQGIRWLNKNRLSEELSFPVEKQGERFHALIDNLRQSPIALDVEIANEQHYELPASFFTQVLGKHLKYSSGYWDVGAINLDDAEEDMLGLYAQRAGLEDGQKVLDLGCGWGSFSLWAAEKFPQSEFTAVSNSRFQRDYILQVAGERNINNISVLTEDINNLKLDPKYDRIISIEMFEHLRNYSALLGRIENWLMPDGKLFLHIFCHKEVSYVFDSEGESNWMGRYFFTSGLMPALDTLLYFQEDLVIEQRWKVSGENYAKTAKAWLENLDRRRPEVLATLSNFYGVDEAKIWLQRWRIFFMACEELFGFKDGSEWMVGHYLFTKR